MEYMGRTYIDVTMTTNKKEFGLYSLHKHLIFLVELQSELK